MKKRIFALALALCMMVSVMPNPAFAGILSVGDGTSTDTTVPSGGSILSVGGNTSTQLSNTGALQNSILSNGSSAGQTDYEFGTATDQSQTSMTINTGSSANEQDTTTQNNAVREPTASDRLSAVAPVTPDAKQLTVSKAISETLQDDNNDPYYKIDLAAKAISNIVVETKATAIDVILILDRSSNMAADNRMSGLITAINGSATTKGFLETVKETAADSRVAVVSYADAGASTIDSAGGTTTDAFVKLSNKTAYDSLRSTISGLNNRIGGDAYSDEAFEKAARIFQAVPASDENYKNPRIVIFFTAGIPGEYGEEDGWLYKVNNNYPAYLVAQESIHWSVILKSEKGATLSVGSGSSYDINVNQEFWTWTGHGNSRTPSTTFTGAAIGCGATVYCVGLELEGCTHTGRHSGDAAECNGTKTNEYLYRISSHRPDGSHVGNSSSTKYNPWEAESGYNWGSTYKDAYTRNIKERYPNAPASYYQVGSVDGISSMFGEISVDVEQNKPLEDVVVRDYLAVGFVPCDEAGNELKVGDKIAGGTVKKDGDVYYIEWAHDELKPGQSVNPSIYVKPVDTLGGRDTKTNIYGPSGLYSDDTLFASFPAPDVDVPVKEIAPNAQSFTIYLSNAADLANLVKLDDRLDGKKNAGVDVTYTIMDGENEVASYTVAKGTVATAFPAKIVEDLQTCKTYTVVCTVDGGAESDADTTYRKVSEKDGTVHVVKPQLTFTDVDVYLGKTPVFDSKPVLTWVTTSPTSGHTCGTPAGKVPDIECTFKNNKAHYLKDTTVTPTANLTGTSGKTYQVVQEDFKVSVYAPVVTYQDTTIYLSENANFEMDSGETTTANLVSTAWEHEGTAADVETMGAAPTLKFNYSAGESGLTVCKDVSVTAVGIDEDEGMIVGETTYSYVDFTTFKKGSQGTDATQFTVHVVKPVFTNSDTTIYLGNSVNLNSLMYMGDNWECDSACTNKQSREKTSVPEAILNSIDHSFSVDGTAVADEYAPDGCATYSIVTTVNSIEVDATDKELEVHVVKPVITSEGIVIYLSNTVDLNGQMTEAADWVCDSSCEKKDTLPVEKESVRVAPELDYEFTGVNPENETDYLTADCRTIIVSATVTGTAPKSAPIAANEKNFVIHVLKPSFAISCTDLWADYMDPVDLDGYNHIELDEVSWSDMTEGHSATEADANAENEPDIDVSDLAFTFDAGENGSYILNQTADKAVNIVSASWTWDTDEDPHVEAFVEKPTFTVHVNKFDLTISKEWKDGEKAADVTYKQDAIFTVAHGQDTFKVVLPAGQSNVKVTGLLCGQTYTVSEDNAWTWRWSSKDAEQEFTGASHDVSAEDPHRKMTDAKHVEEVSFTNNLFNRFWLSFCTFIANIFQKGGN